MFITEKNIYYTLKMSFNLVFKLRIIIASIKGYHFRIRFEYIE